MTETIAQLREQVRVLTEALENAVKVMAAISDGIAKHPHLLLPGALQMADKALQAAEKGER